jgi:ATP-binding cassette, subfamily B, multidrug efflux pump
MNNKAFDQNLFKRILEYSKPYKKLMILVVISAISLSIFAALRPYLLKQTVDLYIQTKDKNGLIFFLALMAFTLVLEVAGQYFFVLYSNVLGQNVVKDVRNKLFDHLLSFKIKYFDYSSVGQLVTRTVSDIEAIARIFSQGLFMIISDLLKMIVVLGFMLAMNWRLTLVVLAILPILIFSIKIFQIKMKSSFEEVRHQVSQLNTFVQERLTGMKIVQYFSRENIEYQKFKDINEKHNKAWLKSILYTSIFFPISDIISSITLGLVVYYGGISIIDGEKFTTLGDLFSYTMFIGLLYNPLRQIADKFNEMQMGMIAARRVFEILDTKDMIQEEGRVEAPKFEGFIQFQNVDFSYKPSEPILKNISFQVQKSETLAIVGATGAGKSTIINLINRFYEIDNGAILIDNQNINDFDTNSLRKQIAVVMQDVFLFADTIFNNITLYNENITKEMVIKAAKEIEIHDFFMSLPNEYDYDVKERGVTLSTGQRQLIAFLRAYLSNPSILILDEATSSIDTNTEELIQKATEKITKNRTSIIIAHRLATVMQSDRILVLDKGEIIEQGNHQELLKNPNGAYKKLYDAQFH